MKKILAVHGRTVALTGALIALSWPLAAHEYYAQSFQIIHPWTQTAASGARAVGLYMRIVDISVDDRLIAASSEIAERIELRMPLKPSATKTAGIELQAGKDLSLSAMSAHLMLHGLKTQLHEGRQYPLRLQFEKAGEIKVDFVVGAH